MSYSPPVFNLNINMWWPAHSASVDPSDGALTAQLYMFSKVGVDIVPSTPEINTPVIYVRISDADRSSLKIGTGCQLEIKNPTTGEAWYYIVRWWETIHLGFPNQYAVLCVEQCNAGRLTPDPKRAGG